MNCSSCGKEISSNDQEFCDSCGTRLNRQQTQTEASQTPPPPPPPPPVSSQGTEAAVDSQMPSNTLHIVLAVVNIATICCCNPISFVLGIIALVMAMGAKKEATVEGAKGKLKTSLILSIVGLVLLVLGTIVSLIMSALGVFEFSFFMDDFMF